MVPLFQRFQAVTATRRRWKKSPTFFQEDEDGDSQSLNMIAVDVAASPNSSKSDIMTTMEPLQVVTNPELEMIETRVCPEGVAMNPIEMKENEELSDDGSIFSSNDDDSLLCLNESEEALLDGPCDDLEVAKYMEKREMTPLQERMNALTMIPTFVYCFFFLLSGSWLDQSMVDEAQTAMLNGDIVEAATNCLSVPWFPNLYALPPLPVIAAGAGVIVHAPFSFIYHWFYAHRLPPGFARTDHWSRRMDQAMIHVISACMAYSTSGRLDFFAVNALYNIDCIYRQFKRRVRPQRNQIRIYISVLAYLIPILRRGDFVLLGKLLLTLGLSGWFFARYPIGGWSHSVFHLIIAAVPPLLMTAATQLPASQNQMDIAAQCAALASGATPH